MEGALPGRQGVKTIPDGLFTSEFERLGAQDLAKKYDLSIRAVYRRRRTLEQEISRKIETPNQDQVRGNAHEGWRGEYFPGRLNYSIVDGVVIVAGDAHYWPSPKAPVMHRALLHFLTMFRQERRLRAMIMNGDATDFAAISRWPQVDWEHRPTVEDEINVCVDRMSEIEQAAGRAHKFWPLGNHDARFSTYIAAHADKLKGIKGVHLKDHFPLWEPCWSIEINEGANTVLVKHTFRASKHGVRLSVENAGCHMITNHTHSAKVIPVTFRHHTFYGVDCGCIADTYGQQFLYLQDNPRDWRSAFAVLTFKGGKLLMPELVLGVDATHIQFRGEVIQV